MNCAARLVCKALGHEPADLHWLPRERRIEYKIATICYSVTTCAAGLTSLNCTPHHALTALLLMIASLVFLRDTNSKDNTLFLPLFVVCCCAA